MLSINTATLWNDITFLFHPLLTEVFFRRSLGALLNIYLDEAYSRIKRPAPLIPMIFAESIRIQSISISGGPSLFDRIMPSLRQPVWPALEELQLSWLGPDRGFPHDFRDFAAPRLKTLVLQNINFPLSIHLFDHLSSLSIENRPEGVEPDQTLLRLAWNELAALFRRANRLQNFKLSNYLPHEEKIQDDVAKPIGLNELQTLELYDTTDSIAEFLSRVSLPALRHRQLSFIMKTEERELAHTSHNMGEHDKVLSLVMKHLAAYPQLNIRHLCLALPEICIRAWSSSQEFPPDIELRTYCSHRETFRLVDHVHFAQSFVSFPCFVNVDHLTVSPELGFPDNALWSPKADFLALFQTNSNIRTLQIGSASTIGLMDYPRQTALFPLNQLTLLSSIFDALLRVDVSGLLPYPKLQELILEVVQIGPTSHPFVDMHGRTLQGYANSIATYLSSRLKAGLPLKRLSIRHCIDVSREIVESLGSDVEVAWDGLGEPVHVTADEDMTDW
jgi:hypothetical protein